MTHCVLLKMFSVAKATLQSPMSVRSSVRLSTFQLVIGQWYLVFKAQGESVFNAKDARKESLFVLILSNKGSHDLMMEITKE